MNTLGNMEWDKNGLWEVNQIFYGLAKYILLIAQNFLMLHLFNVYISAKSVIKSFKNQMFTKNLNLFSNLNYYKLE